MIYLYLGVMWLAILLIATFALIGANIHEIRHTAAGFCGVLVLIQYAGHEDILDAVREGAVPLAFLVMYAAYQLREHHRSIKERQGFTRIRA